MLNFKSFLTESKNVHMEHIEELIFNEGVDGTRKAINFLRDIRDALSGSSNRTSNITVKWDGAPAIFAGIDPKDRKFFVGKKGVFNKNPQVFKTPRDIDNDPKFPNDLKDTFKIALAELKKIGIRDVVQGDLMFGPGDLTTEEIDGQSYTTFQPNTIVYAIPVNNKLAREMRAAKIGVVFHTLYKGKTLDTMKASFGSKIASRLRKSRSVWFDDANYKDQTGLVTFTGTETKNITSILSETGTLFKQTSAQVMNDIKNNEDLKVRMKTYNNSLIRQGKDISSNFSVNDLKDSIKTFWQKEIDKVKTEKSKDTKKQLRDDMIKFIDDNRSEIIKIYRLMGLLSKAKQVIIDKLNKGSKIKTFLRTAFGFTVTNEEGYVAIDKLSTGAVKLVDRIEFSRANFSPDVIKGWEK